MSSPRSVATSGRVGPSGRAALQLIARCPRIPTDVVAVLLGLRHTGSAAQLLARLKLAGLVDCQFVKPGPLVGSCVVRLWTLTRVGLVLGMPERWRDPARQRDLPQLIVVYRMLAKVVCSLREPVQVTGWERPWIRTIRDPAHDRVPVAAVLMRSQGVGCTTAKASRLPCVATIDASITTLGYTWPTC